VDAPLPIASTWGGDTLSFTSGSAALLPKNACASGTPVPAAWPAATD